MKIMEYAKTLLPKRKRHFKYRYRVLGGYAVSNNLSSSAASRYTGWYSIRATDMSAAKYAVKQKLGPRVLFDIKETR